MNLFPPLTRFLQFSQSHIQESASGHILEPLPKPQPDQLFQGQHDGLLFGMSAGEFHGFLQCAIVYIHKCLHIFLQFSIYKATTIIYSVKVKKITRPSHGFFLDELVESVENELYYMLSAGWSQFRKPDLFGYIIKALQVRPYMLLETIS